MLWEKKCRAVRGATQLFLASKIIIRETHRRDGRSDSEFAVLSVPLRLAARGRSSLARAAFNIFDSLTALRPDLGRGRFIPIIFLSLASTVLAQEAILRGVIKDASNGQPTACTVFIRDATGKVLTETESFKAGFRCPGAFVKHLPAGRTQIRITRGFETRVFNRELELLPGQEFELRVDLQRVVDLRKRGWYAGDSHVHMLHGEKTVPVDFDFVALTARAEDLQYLSLAQSWILADPTPEKLATELNQRSTPDCALTWNLEAPKNYYKGDAGRCLGHCWNLGVRGRTAEGRDVVQELMAASAWDYESEKPTYANFESHNLIHCQHGAVFYTHPARWWWGAWGGKGGYPKVERMRVSNMAVELPLDTLIGPTFDGLDVLTTSGEQAANAKAFELWSLLLNHGYRVAATASSDACFDRPGGGVPGSARIYTFLPDGFSIPSAVAATAAGKTFATTGPLLLATMDGLPPGSVFLTDKAHRLNIEAWSSGDDVHGLSRVEVLRNGKVWRTFTLAAPLDTFRTNMPVQEITNGWFCVRVTGGEAENRIAISGAFYLGKEPHRPVEPVPARVRVEMQDAESGRPLSGTINEIRFEGTIPRAGKRHRIEPGGGELVVPGTVRLQAQSKGYRPLTLSPVLDNPELVQTVTGLSDSDLLDWNTFDRFREQLGKVHLVFRLKKDK
ncbi:MAG TPA: CehA/McbA family metallohydrolase [Candidatus Limnocylindrales bacterium]|jgi:hypothetical protein|nr:CehA/McbA family metallohydrolase [Candidatus Limnocylindrales bacterium]